MRAVLADTGPLYAAPIPSDQHHLQARAEMDILRERGLEVVILYPVLLETFSLLLRRASISTAHAWLSGILTVGTRFNPTEDDYLQATDLVRTYHDQPITLTDAILAIVSQRIDVPVWSYDHHFDVLRVPRWTPAT